MLSGKKKLRCHVSECCVLGARALSLSLLMQLNTLLAQPPHIVTQGEILHKLLTTAEELGTTSATCNTVLRRYTSGNRMNINAVTIVL